MKLKQKCALLLVGAMLTGGAGMAAPEQVHAEGETNTFTLTVPADTNISVAGWNDIGSVGVTNASIDSNRYYVSVSIEDGATGRALKEKDAPTQKIGYEIKKGTKDSSEAFGSTLDFSGNGTQTIGAVVDMDDFGSAEAGIYEDTIRFTASMESQYTLNQEHANGTKLRVPDLLASEKGTFTSNGTSYTAYNGFIEQTAGASQAEAKAFVELLNTKKVDGCENWILLSNARMAYDWWLSTDDGDGDASNDSSKGAASFGTEKYVKYLWTSVEDATCIWNCGDVKLNGGEPALRNVGTKWEKYASNFGFVVVRPSAE